MLSEQNVPTAPLTAVPSAEEPSHEVHHPEDTSLQQENVPQIKRVVGVAVDDSEHSRYAVDWAIKNFVKPDDLVLLLTVRPLAISPNPYYVSYIDFTDFVTEMDKKYHIGARDLIKKYSKILTANKITHKGVIMKGDPRDEIVKIVEELHIDTAIVGSRGLGLIKRAFLGSVSDHLAHHLSVPLVIVRPPKEESRKAK